MGGLWDIHSNHLSPCLSIKRRISLTPFPYKRHISVGTWKNSTWEVLLIYPPFYSHDMRKLYWSLSQNRITLWVRKHNMYDLCSLGKKNPLQSSSFSSVIPFAYNTFLSKRERSPSILPGLVKNSSSSNKTAQILPFGVNVLFFHTPKAFKVWRWLSYGTYQDQGHFIFRLSKHESDWINWLWNNLKGLLELWLCLTSVTTFLVETD